MSTATQMTSDDKTMLALAALTYRGFGLHSEARIHAALVPWLPKLETEGLGRWELAWGPATFRASTSFFDDAMMYVARQADAPAGKSPRYALAIRGTNPVSLFDWFFGDFWVQLQIEQPPPSTPSARLSASTALGVAIARRIAAETPPSSSNLFAPLSGALESSLRDFADELDDPHPALLLGAGSQGGGDLKARLASLTGASRAALRTKIFDRLRAHFDGGLAPLHAVDQRVYDGLLQQIENTPQSGTSLRQFLDGLGSGARLAVTGHSKGGALAVGVAHWLATTWAPTKAADVECFSFAGPTAGNAAFAARYNQVLSTRTRRIVNRRDIVPHAFQPDELEKLESIYPLLALALKGLVASVAPLEYEHVGGALIEFTPNVGSHELIGEIVHQHLDAYLREFGFSEPHWTAAQLFLRPAI